MSINQDRPVAEARISPRFQFGLATLFWIMTGTAIVCAVLFPMPLVVAIPLILFISVALPAVLTTVIIYGHSYQRTFCIGAMFPSGVFLLMIPYGSMGLFRFGVTNAQDDIGFRLVVLGFWVSSLLIGGVCVGVRRLVEKRTDSRKP
jgi:hypothetical protein